MGATLLQKPFDTVPAPDGGTDGARQTLRLVSCIIRPDKLDAVKDALNALGVGGMTVTDVRGFGRQKGQVEHYRGGEYTIRFIPKIKIEVGVRAEDVEEVLAAVSRAARTGQVGDGKVFVMEMRHAMRIRTGEQGPGVL